MGGEEPRGAEGALGRPAEGETPKSVALIVRAGAIGDVLASEPAIRAIRESTPGGMEVVLQTRCGESMEGCPHLAGASRHKPPGIGRVFDLNLAYERRLDRPRQAAICEAAGVEYPGPSRYWLTPVAEESRDRVLARDDRPIVVICGYAHWGCRRWDVGKWRDLAFRIGQAGWRAIEVCEPNRSVAAGEPFHGSWWEAVGVIAAASCWVGVDSGPMWASLGLGVPTVALFGPTTPGLVSDHPNLIPITADSSENGCHHREPFPKDRCVCNRDWHPGMEKINVRTVFEAVSRNMRARPKIGGGV